MKHRNGSSQLSLRTLSVALGAAVLAVVSVGTGCARPVVRPVEAATQTRTIGSSGALAVMPILETSRMARLIRTPSPTQVNARQSAADPEAALEGAARRDQVQNVVYRSGVAAACWNDAVAHLPGHRPERVMAQLAVDPQGRARVTVSATEDPRLAQCLRLRLGSQNFGPGGATELETSWNFSLNQ